MVSSAFHSTKALKVRYPKSVANYPVHALYTMNLIFEPHMHKSNLNHLIWTMELQTGVTSELTLAKNTIGAGSCCI